MKYAKNRPGEPLVSVVVPSYNHAKYIADTIKSIIDQDYENIELIVIDDGSQDASAKVIQEMVSACEKRFFRFEFRSRKNKGLCATLNEGIKWCQGKYYSAIASDDLMLPNKTSKQVQYLERNSNCIAVFGGLKMIDSDGRSFRSRPSKPGSYEFSDIFLVKHSFATPTQMIRLNALKNTGLYPEGLYIEDWYMWLKLSHGGARMDDLGEVLVAYRRHEGNMSSQLARMDEARTIIVESYRHDELYEKALSSLNISSALNSQLFSKSNSFKYIREALRIDFLFVVTDKRFYKYIAKFFLPNKLLEKIANG